MATIALDCPILSRTFLRMPAHGKNHARKLSFTAVALSLSAAFASTAFAQAPTIAGCPAFPADNEWNRSIANDPVDPASDAYMAGMNAGSNFLHPDFGGNGEYGIPWIAVSGNQSKVPVSFDYEDDSDAGPYPIPPQAPIEGGPNGDGDRHVLVVDRDACRLYETFDSWPQGGSWRAGSGAIFDLRSNALRPEYLTSADAAGLPILPGLVRHDEVQAGRINHALRFTVRRTQRAFVHPARHFASTLTDPSLPPMGLRVRLKANFDVSGYSPAARVILTALKEYGMFMADNGADWFISGEANPAWNDDELSDLARVPATAFEVVKHGALTR
ncbi:MAG TPA: hypothetical protein VGG33_20930 [Polyangia bacterium]